IPELTDSERLGLMGPAVAWELLSSRGERSLHDVLPVGYQYIITHNRAADGTQLRNNQVSLVAAYQIADRSAWRTVFEHSPTVKLDGVDVTRAHLFAAVRAEITPRLWVMPLDGLGTEAEAEVVGPAFPEGGDEACAGG